MITTNSIKNSAPYLRNNKLQEQISGN